MLAQSDFAKKLGGGGSLPDSVGKNGDRNAQPIRLTDLFSCIVSRMKLSALLVYFETSPAIKLLRSQHAPYVVDFLHRQFKAAERIVVPHSELLPALASYIEEARELDPEVLRDRPETYLTDWCIGERRWLIRRFGVESQ